MNQPEGPGSQYSALLAVSPTRAGFYVAMPLTRKPPFYQAGNVVKLSLIKRTATITMRVLASRGPECVCHLQKALT